MTTIFCNRPPKPVRATLKTIWREYRRCAYRYPPLYHELFRPCWSDEVSDLDGPAICAAFREANRDRLSAPWQDWHATPDGELFGRYTGAQDGLDEFRRLAESAYLVVRDLAPDLPDYGDQGWLMILHEMANSYPTPLLRSELSHWGLEHTTDDDYDDEMFDLTEKWARSGNGGMAYPLHPSHWVLRTNLYTASMAATELILDADKALLVGSPIDDFPVAFRMPNGSPTEADRTSDDGYGVATERVETPDPTDAVAEDYTASYGPISFRYSAKWQRWHLRFESDDAPLEEGTFGNHHGFWCYAVAVNHPDPTGEGVPYWRINVDAGLAPPPTETEIAMLEAESSPQQTLDTEGTRKIRKEVGQIEKVLEEIEVTLSTCVNPERQEELEQQRATLVHRRTELTSNLDKSKVCRRRERIIPDSPQRQANILRTYCSKVRTKIAPTMPRCAEYLKRYVRARRLRFVFLPPNLPLMSDVSARQ